MHIFCTPLVSGFYFKVGNSSKCCLSCRCLGWRVRVWCSWFFVPRFSGAPVLKKRRIFCWEFPEKSPSFFFNSFSPFKRTAKELWDSLRETLKKLSKIHGRCESSCPTVSTPANSLLSSPLDTFVITYSSWLGKIIWELFRLWFKLLIESEILQYKGENEVSGAGDSTVYGMRQRLLHWHWGWRAAGWHGDIGAGWVLPQYSSTDGLFFYKIDKKDGEGVVNLISPLSGPFGQLAVCISFWCWQLHVGGGGTWWSWPSTCRRQLLVFPCFHGLCCVSRVFFVVVLTDKVLGNPS